MQIIRWKLQLRREQACLDELNEIIEKALKSMRIHIEKLFPYTDAGKPGLIRKYGQLIKEEYREDGILVEAYVPAELMDRLQ